MFRARRCDPGEGRQVAPVPKVNRLGQGCATLLNHEASDWKVDIPAVQEGKRRMVDGMVVRNHELYRESGAELIMGQGFFVGPRTIQLTADDGAMRSLRGDMVVSAPAPEPGSTPSPASPNPSR